MVVYPARMYPPSRTCRGISNTYQISVTKSGKSVGSVKFSDVKGYGWVRLIDSEPGEYVISARQTGGYSSKDMNDFSVNVYSKE
jgi:hypothetical protein